MKKFYTLALAAAVALSAAAVAPKGSKAALNEPRELKSAENLVAIDGKADLKASQKLVSTARKAPAKAGEAATVEGTYFDQYFLNDNPNILFDKVVITKSAGLGGLGGSNKYKVANLFSNLFSQPKEIDATFGNVTFNTSTGPVDMPTLTITAGANVYGGYGIYFFMYDEVDGRYYYYSNQDIYFVQDTDGTLFIPYEGACIGFVNPTTGSGNLFEDLNVLFTPNGHMTYTGIDDDYYYVDAEGDILAYQIEESLYVYGMPGASCPIVFTIDTENNTAVALNQVAVPAFINSLDVDFKYQELLDGDDPNPDFEVPALLANNEDGTSSLTTLPGREYWAYEDDIVDEDGWGYYWGTETIFGNVDMLLNFRIEGLSAVKNVAVENNANAPVEYFNLQGVRVAEPAAGNVYIRRQGNDVKKIVIR